MQNYKCSICNALHHGLPFSYGSSAPALWFMMPEAERTVRALLSSDQCVIDDKYFFVLGCLEIPVLDALEADESIFKWLVWVSLSENSFQRMSDLWETVGRESEPPYFGWLSTALPSYPETTLHLKTSVHTRPVGERPLIELEATEHPLAVEQRQGITLKRVQEIAECVLHNN